MPWMLYSSPQGWFHGLWLSLPHDIHQLPPPRIFTTSVWPCWRARSIALSPPGRLEGERRRPSARAKQRAWTTFGLPWTSVWGSVRNWVSSDLPGLSQILYACFMHFQFVQSIHFYSCSISKKNKTAENGLISSNICFQTQPEEVISQVCIRWGILLITMTTTLGDWGGCLPSPFLSQPTPDSWTPGWLEWIPLANYYSLPLLEVTLQLSEGSYIDVRV